jgi:cyclase
VQEVSEGIFAYIQPDGTWWINNTRFIAGHDRVAAVDACATEARTRALLTAIGSVTPAPVRTLVNTHHHGDHTYGNSVFLPHATVVGHAECAEQLLAAGLQLHQIWPDIDWGEIILAPPTTTYSTTVHRLPHPELRIELIHPGVAHTTGDTIVWLPEQRIAFAGDLLMPGRSPFCFMGSATGMLTALQVLRELDPAVIVPGHGPVCGPEAIDDAADYFHRLLELARRTRAEGTDPLAAARAAEAAPHSALGESERLGANLLRALADLDGTPPGAPLPLGPALSHMIALNGGTPLRCCA